jgi:hypothetical protein
MNLNKLITELAAEETGKVNITITLAAMERIISELENRILENKVDDSLRKEEKESEETLYTPDETLAKLNLKSKVTLWHWEKKGILKSIKLSKGIKRYRKSDIDYLLTVS